MIKMLKNDEIKKQKPDLKLKPNHYHFISDGGRIWRSENRGMAYSDGRGWYQYDKGEKK